MTRKIIVNLLASFVLVPTIFISKYWENIISGNYQYYDNHYYTLSKYIYILLHEQGYPILSVFSLLCIFLPYQIIKDYFFRKKIKIIFIYKIILLIIIIGFIVLIFGSLYDIWKSPWWGNYIYIIFVIGLGTFFTSLLYFTVDRYVEVQKDN